MASENPHAHEETKPLEEKVADLHLQDKEGADKEGAVGVAVQEYLDGATEAVTTSSKEADSAGLNETAKEGEKRSEESAADERNIAKEEVAKSADEGAYVVPTVDHRSAPGSVGEENKVNLPTAVVHENVDTGGKEQQGKGIVGKISSSVKSMFSGITGSKAAKTSDDTQK